MHVDGEGLLCAGTCAGVVLGRATDAASVGEIWHRLAASFADRDQHAPGGDGPAGDFEVVSLLSAGGPAGLLTAAERLGYQARPAGYAGKCHLCWHVRRWLFENGCFAGGLGPAVVYRP